MKPIFALPLALLLGGCITVKDSGGGSRYIQSSSPTQMGEAIIRKEIGMQDSAVIFEVRDPKKGEKPINVGFVGDEKWKGDLPKAAMWSVDGSVVAVQGAGFQSWSHAYDFKSGVIVEDLYSPFKGNIDKLLKSRGGIGPKVLDDWAKFDQVAKPVPNAGRS